MPPAYVNVGAWIGAGTMVDSHALVGSCAQIGSRVHLSAGAMVGGVLEPVGALPVIVEDDVLIGMGSVTLYYRGARGMAAEVFEFDDAGLVVRASAPRYLVLRARVRVAFDRGEWLHRGSIRATSAFK